MKTLKFPLYSAIFLIPLLLNPWGMNMYSNPKIVWFLICMAGLFGYLGYTILSEEKISLFFHRTIYLFLAALWLTYVFSTFFSATLIQSIFGEYSEANGALFALLILVHFLVCLQIFQKEETIRGFFAGLKILAGIISIHAIFQFFNIDPFTDVNNAQYLFRIYGTLGQPNFLGQFLIFPIAIVLFDLEETLWKKDWKKSIFNGFLVIFFTITLFLTKNRATEFALIFGFFIWGIFFLPIKKIFKFLGGIIFGSAVVAVLFFGGIDTRSLGSRSLLWEGAVQSLTVQNFFMGSGPDSFESRFVTVMPKKVFEFEEFYTVPNRVHNEFLEVFVERGIFGAVLYLLPLAFLAYLLFWKKIQNSTQKIPWFAVAMFTISVQFSFSVLEHSVYLAAFWAILLLQTLPFSEISVSLKNFVVRFVSATTTLFLSITLFFGSLFFLKSDMLLPKGINAYVNDLKSSYEIFNEAAEIVPFFGEPRKTILELFLPFAKGDEFLMQEMEKHLLKYGDLTNENFRYEIFAMEFSAARNDLSSVEMHLREGKKKAPDLPALYTAAGNIYFEHGNCSKALENYFSLLSLAPSKYYLEKSSDPDERNLFRIFKKHASQFFEAMQKRETCLLRQKSSF
ncbi:O-antigen ligase family protein [Candidatus Peregrinibacteria bacterium]|nr:O-antigen ligase family protein [Candidatus Peregrinibacteria bacterium]